MFIQITSLDRIRAPVRPSYLRDFGSACELDWRVDK